MKGSDIAQQLRERVLSSYERKTKLQIIGGNSKNFYGRAAYGEPLHIDNHFGIVNYDPRELVLTVRAGTSLNSIKHALDAEGQMLAFEPPQFSDTATIGGAIAAGLSGPCRPYTASARDTVLGCQVLNGKGEFLHFGGQVMKNVAGYDVSRLMTGAMGTLGVLLQISLKVLPKPAASETIMLNHTPDAALGFMNSLKSKPLPVDGVCYVDDHVYVRLSGSANAVESARKQLGGELYKNSHEFWRKLRELKLPYFDNQKPLWRFSITPAAPLFSISNKCLLDWGGAQRWICSEKPAEELRKIAEDSGGHAVLFRGGNRNSEVFHPLPATMKLLHKRLKATFDPAGIFNPGRLYSDM